MTSSQVFDCIVIGAGAAGLMCAATAGQRGRQVLVLDHANKVGKKILMSGGGRCNFTNLYMEPDNYLSANPYFCKSALSRYTQYDFLELVSRYNLAYHDKGAGELFCDDKARDILNILLAECEKGGVNIQTDTAITAIEKTEQGQFVIDTERGQYQCHSLVIATGGLSIPKMGATGFGYKVARQFGLQVKDTEPALVPFTLSDAWLTVAQELAGVAMDIRVSCRQQSFNEALLFTHRGLSGPAILQISNYWYSSDEITIDFLPGHSVAELIEQWVTSGEKATIKTLLSQYLPKRFVLTWLGLMAADLGDKLAKQLVKKDIEQLTQFFHHWTIKPSGTEGYRTAEVTRGGVDTDGISSKTFEAKTTANLYFIGEVLDVTGWLGGFNFQWAWSSGWCAGQYV
ncbi:NAD(P)/FAD-dependent oxidoreductase [Methylophaga sp.]|uniref:NAD(P)/FAD-dependent oxidoreductase n=1 Tax=Methylophaga sp. TaxID=2024840 RepID=UPI003A8EC49B